MNFQYFFYAFICNVSNDIDYYDEYIIIKYSEDIVDLFLQMKTITQSYGSFFFMKREGPLMNYYNLLFVMLL